MVKRNRRSPRDGGLRLPKGNRLSQRMMALAAPTRRRLAALCDAIAPHARRHPHDPVPHTVLTSAQALLADAQKILSSEGGTRPRFRAAPLWAELDAALQLVRADLTEVVAQHGADTPAMTHIRAALQRRIEELNRGPLQGSSDYPE